MAEPSPLLGANTQHSVDKRSRRKSTGPFTEGLVSEDLIGEIYRKTNNKTLKSLKYEETLFFKNNFLPVSYQWTPDNP